MEWNDGHPSHRVTLTELAAVTPEAHAALWPALLDLDLVGTITSRAIAIDDPLPLLLENPRALRTTDLNDGVWLNVLDIPACFGGRTYRVVGPDRRRGRRRPLGDRRRTRRRVVQDRQVAARPGDVARPVQLAALRRRAPVGAGRRRPDAGPQRGRRSAAPTSSSRPRSRRTASPSTDGAVADRPKVGGRWTTRRSHLRNSPRLDGVDGWRVRPERHPSRLPDGVVHDRGDARVEHRRRGGGAPASSRHRRPVPGSRARDHHDPCHGRPDDAGRRSRQVDLPARRTRRRDRHAGNRAGPGDRHRHDGCRQDPPVLGSGARLSGTRRHRRRSGATRPLVLVPTDGRTAHRSGSASTST